MFGKSLFDLISEKRKEEYASSVAPGYAEAEAMDPIGSTHNEEEPQFRLQLRRKRKSAMLKRMLVDGGYGDLAKTVTVREVG